MRAGEAQIILDPSLVVRIRGLESGQEAMEVFYFDRTQGFEFLRSRGLCLVAMRRF
jgi:hypothetical protein